MFKCLCGYLLAWFTESGQSGTISIPRKNAETEVSNTSDHCLLHFDNWLALTLLKLFFQETPEEDFSEPSVDEHSVHNEFISDSFAQTSQGNNYQVTVLCRVISWPFTHNVFEGSH